MTDENRQNASAPLQPAERIYIRPTLIIGLGGSGARIATELKARLEEQLGVGSHYDQAVRFVCFDTANENFKAYHPNNPEAVVELAAGREFIRISDVPLYDLSSSADANPAIASIMPESLHSTQIDQGAQQVRRLGRIALFYRYSLVKDALSQALRELRSRDRVNPLGVTPDAKEVHVTSNERIRVYIITSICGGTGSGTFLDMAYLVRHFSKSLGEVDVHGLLLLPEAFPEIATTGQQRIRANAYAALLDLEYYNQATSDSRALYQVDFPDDPVEVHGRPFTNCYLINDGTIGGTGKYAPLLAEILQVMMTSRAGEQLDATLDNIRGYLNVYYGGYRAFYSALGLGQIILPKAWQRQQFSVALQRVWIEDVLLADAKRGSGDDNDPDTQASGFFNTLGAKIGGSLTENLRRDALKTLVPLTTLNLNALPAERIAATIQESFFEVESDFQRSIVRRVQDRAEAAFNEARQALVEAVRANVNKGLDTSGTLRGLSWSKYWLDTLEARINDALRKEIAGLSFAQRAQQLLTRQMTLLKTRTTVPVIGAYQTRRQAGQARQRLVDFLEDEAKPESRLVNDQRTQIYARLLAVITVERENILNALRVWRDHLRAVQRSVPDSPSLAPLMQSAINAESDRARLLTAARQMVFSAANTPNTSELKILSEPRMVMVSTQKPGIGSLYDSTDPNHQRDVLGAFVAYCTRRYEETAQATGGVTAVVTAAMLRDIGKQAKPLMAYNAGLIPSTPREIKVLGARQRREADALLDKIGDSRTDQSSVETGDADRLQYFVTHHGIPAYALNGFEDYRRNYEALSAKPDDPNSRYAIFHLDNERENAPHDPGSIYFINHEDLEMRFARALAYGWLERSHITLYEQSTGKAHAQSAIYVFPDKTPTASSKVSIDYTPLSLYGYMAHLAQQQAQELFNQINTVSDELKKHQDEDSYEKRKQERKLDQHRRQLDTLRRYFILNGDKESSVDGHIAHEILIREMKGTYVEGRNQPNRTNNDVSYMIMTAPNNPPISLNLALEALYADPERLLPNLFIKAFDAAFKQADTLGTKDGLDSKLSDFLADRGILDPDKTDTQWLNTVGEASRLMEERLCSLLLVYHRANDRRMNGQRLTHYYHKEVDDVRQASQPKPEDGRQ